MLDFRRRSRTRAVRPAGGEIRRLLALGVALALVVLVMSEAGDPSNWLWSLPRAGGHRREAAAAVEVPRRSRLDQASTLPIAADGQPAQRRADGAPAQELLSADQRRRFDVVKDDAAFRSAEMPIFFQTLAALRDATLVAIERASTGPVSYVQLFEQPSAYRGEVVDLSGVVRRATRVAAPKNDAGIAHYYQVVIEPDDRPEPVIVYALALPQNFPTGMTLDERAGVTGVFFKRWVYLAGDGMRTAPLVLSKTLDWRPAAPVAAAGNNAARGIWESSIVWTCGLAIVAWLVLRSRVGRGRVEFRVGDRAQPRASAPETIEAMRAFDRADPSPPILAQPHVDA